MSEILGTLFKYLMATLAVIAVLAMNEEARQNARISSAITDISLLSVNIKKLYSAQQNYSTISNAEINSDDPSIIPGDWMGWLNQWGGAVTVSPSSAGTQFSVILQSVPSGACVELLMDEQADSADAGSPSTHLVLPTTLALAIPACTTPNGPIAFNFM